LGRHRGREGPRTLRSEQRLVHPVLLDIGTGNSDFTWQIQGGIGYAYPWGELIATWRYLDYKFKSDSKLEDLTVNGPVFGVAFRW
jgi:hypothetical protein